MWEPSNNPSRRRVEGHAGPRRAPARRRAGGQALVLGVVCLLVLALALFAVFDTGQVVSKKLQLANAADAAAYSVGIEQARALNTIAYLNRAEVANQVAIAQIVSIQSYANYADSLLGRSSNLLYAAGIILDCCYVGEVMQGIAEGMRGVQDGYAQYVIGQAQALGFAVDGLDALNGIYSTLQETVVAGFSAQAGLSTVTKVVEDNTLDAQGSHALIPLVAKGLLAMQISCFGGGLCTGPTDVTSNRDYAKRYAIPQNPGPASSERSWAGDRDANVMMAARDLFSTQRNGDISISPLPLLQISATKLGGTDLVDYDRWVAVDDLGINVEIGFCSGWISVGPCKKVNGATLGLSAAAATPSDFQKPGGSTPVISPGISLTQGSGTPASYHPGTGGGWYSPYSGALSPPYQDALGNVAGGADVAANPSDIGNDDWVAGLSGLMGYAHPVPPDATTQNVVWVGHTHGLRDYNDVAPGKAVEPYATSVDDASDVGPVFTVYVQQADSTVRTGANVGMEGGRLKLQNQGMGGEISAVSSAQVYYDRPADLPFMRRADGTRELGNLFEPYWQARLVSTPTSIKALLGLTTVAGL